MGAETSKNHYEYEWKVWGLIGEFAGKVVDTTRLVLDTLRERRQTEATTIGHETLRAVVITEGATITPEYAGATVLSSVVELRRD